LDFSLFYQNLYRNAENLSVFSDKSSILSILAYVELLKKAQNKQSILRLEL